MPVFAVDNNGHERGEHDGEAKGRSQHASRRAEKQNGSREFQRSGHEMEPARIPPFHVFLVYRSRGENVAEGTDDEESGKD